MTEQFQQTNINQPMSGARYVDQRDIDTSLTPDAIPLDADDEFIIVSDFDDQTPIVVNLPEVSEVTGKDIVIKTRVTPPTAILITVAGRDGTGQTIDGALSVAFPGLLPGETLVVRADPPDNTVDPVAQPTNWSIIRGPSAP